MQIKIKDICDLSIEEKRNLLGPKYNVTITVHCNADLKRFNIEYIPDYDGRPKVRCPGCGQFICLPNGKEMAGRSLFPFPQMTTAFNLKPPVHDFKDTKKVEIGFYEPNEAKGGV